LLWERDFDRNWRGGAEDNRYWKEGVAESLRERDFERDWRGWAEEDGAWMEDSPMAHSISPQRVITREGRIGRSRRSLEVNITSKGDHQGLISVAFKSDHKERTDW
jgi:hypothetical protein